MDMDPQNSWTKIAVKELGPIARAQITLKPLTLIIGKNCYGKSLLINLLYLLASTLPDFPHLKDLMGERIMKLSEESYAALKSQDIGKLKFKILELLKLYLDGLGPAISLSLTKRFNELVQLEELSQVFHGEFRVTGLRKYALCRAHLSKGKLKLTFCVPNELDLSVISIAQTAPESYMAEIEFLGEKHRMEVNDPRQIGAFVGLKLIPGIMFDFRPLAFGLIETYLLTDSRAGILRLASAAIDSSLEYGRLMIPLRESVFLSSYSKLAWRIAAKEFAEELPKYESLYKQSLAELGLDEIEVRSIGGRPVTFIKDKWGKQFPLENAPSGIRETVPIIVACISKPKTSEIFFVEELEVHLHPKALTRMLELACTAIIHRKPPGYLIATTHNPLVLSILNNLILRVKGLYEIISIIHLKEQNGKVLSEDVRVTKRGFDETKLGNIFVELLEERAHLA